jgi:2-oxoisovalerate dehydrogenase E1 component
MAVSRAEIVERNVAARVSQQLASPPRAPLAADARLRADSDLTAAEAARVFEAMVASRALDLEARQLKHQDAGYYTIGSAGHEANAILGELLRVDDPAFVHYRSGAFMMARARKVKGETPIRDAVLSFVAAVDDPTAGGRHKVWGSKRLWVPPQTSTIASHIPKATGLAFAHERAKRLGLPIAVASDAIVMASIGDASINHNVAMSGFNTAAWACHQKLPIPILYVCEDNGIGISVKTPAGWVETRLRTWPDIAYFGGDGLDLCDAWRSAREAVDYVRATRKPAFLHWRVVRLLGHAGSDVETEYHTNAEIEEVEARDPLLAAVDLLAGSGALSAERIQQIFEETRAEVRKAARDSVSKRKLGSLAEVTAPLAPYHADKVSAEAKKSAPAAAREKAFGGAASLPERHPKPRPMATLLSWGLRDLLAQHPEMFVFGEDVAKKGGVYHVTAGLFEAFGAARVFNTLLDETSILGLGIGMAHAGLLPVPEIQYLAYLHNAEDQLRGEACSLQFFSNAQFRNPMVVRIASFAYQKGFGGHFHNDNAIGVLRDIPGLVIAAPSRGDDAVAMLRTCVALAKTDGRVVAFLEPIALYHEKDLLESGDGGWLTNYPPPGEAAPFGEAKLYREGKRKDATDDLLIVSYANGFRLSQIAAARLGVRGFGVRVLDLRWLAPLDHMAIVENAEVCGRVLVVDECRQTGGGVAEAILADLALRPETRNVAMARVAAADTYIPLGPAANLCLPSAESIEEAALRLLGSDAAPPGSKKKKGRARVRS